MHDARNQLLGLMGCAAILTSLGDVLHRTNVDGLLRGARLSHAATAGSTRRGSRRHGACDLNRVTDVLAQDRSISGQLNVVAVAVRQRVIPMVTAQAAFDGSCAAAGRVTGSTLTGIVLCGGPARAEQEHRK